MSYKGWHSRGYLPHFDSAETVQFVTIRLADSLPKTVAAELSDLPENPAEADHRLDDGWGSVLAQTTSHRSVGQRYHHAL